MHSAYSRRTSNHVFFRFPSRAAGAGERRDASAWSSRGALAGLGSENTSRVSRESSARSRTRSTSPARRPTGAGLQSASARRVFSRLRQLAFFGSSDAPTRDRASGRRRYPSGHSRAPRDRDRDPYGSCRVSHPRAKPRQARGVPDATAAPHLSCPQLRPKTGRTRLSLRSRFRFGRDRPNS